MVTIHIAWIIVPLWLLIGLFNTIKSRQVGWQLDEPSDGAILVACMLFAPLFLLVAIIRQVFFEKWR